ERSREAGRVRDRADDRDEAGPPPHRRPGYYRMPTCYLVFVTRLAVAAACVCALISATASAQVRVQAIDGTPADALAAPPGTKAIVFLFTSTDCPISNRYAPEVRRVVSTYASQGVVFRLLYRNSAAQAPAIREKLAPLGYRAP